MELDHIDLNEIEANNTSKKETRSFAVSQATSLADARSATDVYTQLTRVEEYCKAGKEAIKGRVVEERERYSSKELIRANGMQIDIMESGVRYDFSHCGDDEWDEYAKKEAFYAKLRKKREQFLKSLTEPLHGYHPETGETFTTYPPRKTSSTVPKISW